MKALNCYNWYKSGPSSKIVQTNLNRDETNPMNRVSVHAWAWLCAQGPGPRAQGPRAQGPRPKAQGPGPRAQGPAPRAQGPGRRAQGPMPGPRPRAEGPSFFKATYCARILIEGTRFPPFGFAIAEISSNSNEDVSFGRKDLLCPDSDRGRSVSPPSGSI